MLYLYLHAKSDFFSAPLKVLHFAPEFCFQEQFKRQSNLAYISADKEGGYSPGMVAMDMTAICAPENTYDVVLCIHVLEHIDDDRKAIREIYRVLKPGGWSILTPHLDLDLEKTYEDSRITSPEDRKKHFNQEDHYRVYGRDLKARVEEAGFHVEVGDYKQELNSVIIHRYGLETAGPIYRAIKPK